MGTKTLRINDIGMATVDLRKFGSKSPIRRFRYFIENTDWDERILEHLRRMNGASLIVASAAAIYIVFVGIRILFF